MQDTDQCMRVVNPMAGQSHENCVTWTSDWAIDPSHQLRLTLLLAFLYLGLASKDVSTRDVEPGPAGRAAGAIHFRMRSAANDDRVPVPERNHHAGGFQCAALQSQTPHKTSGCCEMPKTTQGRRSTEQYH